MKLKGVKVRRGYAPDSSEKNETSIETSSFCFLRI